MRLAELDAKDYVLFQYRKRYEVYCNKDVNYRVLDIIEVSIPQAV